MGETRPPGSSQRPRRVPALLLAGHELPLTEGDTVIGRAASCHVSITGGLVSRRHAKISNQSGRATVEDLGSRNGIFLNGQKVVAPTVLQDGDRLLIGTTEVTFFLALPDDESPPSSRHRFDERGNPLPRLDADEDDWGPPTEVRIERPPLPEFDREDITAVGTRPPAPGSSVATRAKASPTTQRSPAAPAAAGSPALELDLPTPPSGALRKRPTKPASAPPQHSVGTGTLPSRGVAVGRVQSSAPPRATAAYGSDGYGAVLDVVSRMMARGDIDAAGRTLAAHVTHKLDAIREGAALEPRKAQRTANLCLDLAAATREPAWFDAAIDCCGLCRQLLTSDAVARVQELLASLPQASLVRLKNYQAVVKDLMSAAPPDERELCRRILALSTDGV